MIARQTVVVTYFWRDGTGSPGFTDLHTAPAEFDVVHSRATSLVARLLDFSDCSLPEYTMKQSYFDNTPAPPGGTAPITRRALMVFRCEGVDQFAVIEIPGATAVIIDSEDPHVELDITDPTLQNLADTFISLGFCNPMGHAVTELLSAYVEIVP